MDVISLLIIATLALIWLPWLWRYQYKPRQARNQIKQFLKSHPRAQYYLLIHDFLQTLYKRINARRISTLERKRLRLQEDAFVYGEIDFLSFMLILDKAQPQANESFYDLGSGSGKALFTATLCYDFKEVLGVELLPGLCKLAQAQVHKAKVLARLVTGAAIPDALEKLDRIKVKEANFLNVDLFEADIVFINATCLSYTAWETLKLRFKQLKAGSRIIVTTKKMDDPEFEVLYQGREVMSWGLNSVNIYRKQ